MNQQTMTPEQRDQLNKLLSMATLKFEGDRGYIDGQYDPNMTTLMRGGPQQAPQPAPQQAPMPQNYLRNNSTGKVTDFGPSHPQPFGDGQGYAPDYSQPVEFGNQKGYWLKGANNKIVTEDGRVHTFVKPKTREDLAREYAELQSEKLRRELEGVEGADEYNKIMQRGRAAAALSQIPGTPQYREEQKIAEKERASKEKSDKGVSYALANADTGLGALADIAGVPRDQLGTAYSSSEGMNKVVDRLTPVAGAWNELLPNWMVSGKTVDVRSAAERLKKLARTGGLQALREAGVAPGSVTEKEWPLFEADLANLDLSQSETSLAKQLGDAYRKLNEASTNARAKLNSGGTAQRGAAVPVRSEAEAQSLPVGTRFQLPDGRTGTIGRD